MPRSVIHENSTTTSGDSDSATWHERIADDERDRSGVVDRMSGDLVNSRSD